MKQTEIGLIPDDWEVKTLNDIGKFIGGGTPNTNNANYWKGNIPWISSSDISKDSINTLIPTRFITKEAVSCSATKLCPKNTILIVSRVGVGKLAISNTEVCTSQDFTNLVCNENVDENFIAYQLLPKLQHKASEAQGTSIKGITTDEVRELQIPIPPLAEQQRIAKALSDIDALISTTEKLIQKKKNIKQGTMQNLLTGKKRLPGFGDKQTDLFVPNGTHTKEVKDVSPEQIRLSAKMKQTELGEIPEDWEVKNINKECTIKARIGWQGLKSTEYLDSGDFILITGTDFDSGFINWKSCSYVTKWRFDQDKNIQIKQGDVLITKDGTIGKVAFLNEIPMQGTLNSGVFVIRPKNPDKMDSVFLSLIFKSFWFDAFLEQITSGSTIVHLYQKDFIKFNFPLPSKEEQTAIAKVLSSMDKEIETLNTKLEKYRNLKTAMMQQLLMGKIRLV